MRGCEIDCHLHRRLSENFQLSSSFVGKPCVLYFESIILSTLKAAVHTLVADGCLLLRKPSQVFGRKLRRQIYVRILHKGFPQSFRNHGVEFCRVRLGSGLSALNRNRRRFRHLYWALVVGVAGGCSVQEHLGKARCVSRM